jgi:hypothetical protein
MKFRNPRHHVAAGDWKHSNGMPVSNLEIARCLGCLIPDFDGATFFVGWKEALWDEFFMAAPTTTGGA